jgi:hypothetical protein
MVLFADFGKKEHVFSPVSSVRVGIEWRNRSRTDRQLRVNFTRSRVGGRHCRRQSARCSASRTGAHPLLWGPRRRARCSRRHRYSGAARDAPGGIVGACSTQRLDFIQPVQTMYVVLVLATLSIVGAVNERLVLWTVQDFSFRDKRHATWSSRVIHAAKCHIERV